MVHACLKGLLNVNARAPLRNGSYSCSKFTSLCNHADRYSRTYRASSGRYAVNGSPGVPDLPTSKLFRDRLYGIEEERGYNSEEDFPRGQSIAQILRMGTWRLRGLVSPAIEALVSQIENAWRAALGDDLALYHIPEKFKMWDSLDPDSKRKDRYSYHTWEEPEKGQPGWPRLQVENRAYRSRVFRKMHLEVAYRQDGLEVLHMVAYPHPQFDVPILSLDIVGVNDQVSLAIVDVCPVTLDRSIPPLWMKGVQELQNVYKVKSNRELPEWGEHIVSPCCLCLRPGDADEVLRFIKYAVALNLMHVNLARLATSVTNRDKLEEIYSAHRRYVDKQLENDKTLRVLEKSFGVESSEEYMTTVMFDCPPK